MYISTAIGLGQPANNQVSEQGVLRQLLEYGLRANSEIDGRRVDIFLSPTMAKLPYIAKQSTRAQEYWMLPEHERKNVTDVVDRVFREATGISRKLDPKNTKDLPWIRVWLRLRDQMMVGRMQAITYAPYLIRAQFAPSSQSTASAPQIFRAQFTPSKTPAAQNVASKLIVKTTNNYNEIFVYKAEGGFVTPYKVRRIPRMRVIKTPTRAGICWKDGRVFGRVTWCGDTQGTFNIGTNLPGQGLNALNEIKNQLSQFPSLNKIGQIVMKTRVEAFTDLLVKAEKNWELTANFKLELFPDRILSTEATAKFDTKWFGLISRYRKDADGNQVFLAVDFHDKRTIRGKKCEQFAIWWEPLCEVPTQETLYLYFEKGKDTLPSDPKLGTALLNKNTLDRLDVLVSRGYWLESVNGYTSPEGLRPKSSTFEGNKKLSEKRAEKVRVMIQERYVCGLRAKRVCMQFPNTKRMPPGVGHSEHPTLDVRSGKASKELEGAKLDLVMIKGDKTAVNPEQRLSFLERYPEELKRMTQGDRNIIEDGSRTLRERAEKLFENLRRVEIHLRYGTPLPPPSPPNTFLSYSPAILCPEDVIAKAREVWGLQMPFNRFDPPLCD